MFERTRSAVDSISLSVFVYPATAPLPQHLEAVRAVFLDANPQAKPTDHVFDLGLYSLGHPLRRLRDRVGRRDVDHELWNLLCGDQGCPAPAGRVPDEDRLGDAVSQLGFEGLPVRRPRPGLVHRDSRSDDLMAASGQQRCDLVPDPGTVPAPVDQREESQGAILRGGSRGPAPHGVESARLVEALELVQAAVFELDA